MFLRIARTVLVAVGLIVLGYGVAESFQHDGDDNGMGATWDCHPIGDGPDTRCQAAYENTDDTHVAALCVAGVGLICASMAIGSLESRARSTVPAHPSPAGQPARFEVNTSARQQSAMGPQGPQRQQTPAGTPMSQAPRHPNEPWHQ